MAANDMMVWAQVVAETVLETGGAPEGVLYIGLQRAGLPHGAAGLDAWRRIVSALKTVGYIEVSNNYITPTDKLRGAIVPASA